MAEFFSGGLISNLLLIGLLLGMRHALEADHIAAIAALTSKKQPLSYTIKQGIAWGSGHTITLLLFGSIVIFMDTIIPEYLAMRLEIAVGIMLIILGADVVRGVILNKIHFHEHKHENGDHHFHAHSHAGEVMTKHNKLQHQHQHADRFPVKALIVGLMHGMAGSAAVIILTLDMGTTPMQGVFYILLFGVGSIIGMTLLTVVISLPIRLFSRQLTFAHNIFQSLIGVITIGLGIVVIYQNSSNLFI